MLGSYQDQTKSSSEKMVTPKIRVRQSEKQHYSGPKQEVKIQEEIKHHWYLDVLTELTRISYEK